MHSTSALLVLVDVSNILEFHFWNRILTSCAARWPPQYSPAPADRRVSLCGLWARTAHLCTEFEGHSFILDDDMTYFDSEH